MARIVKGEKRGERYAGKWLCDYRDLTGTRHVKSFATKAAAEDFYARVAIPAARRDRTAFQADRKTTLQQCFEKWIAIARGSGHHLAVWRRYCGELASLEARLITRQRGEGLLLRLKDKVGGSSLRLTYLVVNHACGEALEMGLLTTNSDGGTREAAAAQPAEGDDGHPGGSPGPRPRRSWRRWTPPSLPSFTS